MTRTRPKQLGRPDCDHRPLNRHFLCCGDFVQQTSSDMRATCNQLFVMFVQDGHVHPIFRTETMIMQSRLFPDLVRESLLHFTEERAGVTTRVSLVDVWVFGGIPFPRRDRDDVEVVQGSHCCSHWAPNHTYSIWTSSSYWQTQPPKPGDINLRKSVLHFLTLKLEPRTKLVQREPDTRVPIFTKVEV